MTAFEPGQQRLVQLVRESLAAYSDGRVTLAQLVSDVESVIGSLAEVAEAEWVEEVRSLWWQLEFAHAMSLDEQRPLTEEEDSAVNAAVEALSAMLVAY